MLSLLEHTNVNTSPNIYSDTACPDDTSCLSIVGSSSGSDITSLRDVLDGNSGASLTGDSDPGRGGTGAGRDLEEVVGGSGSSLPSLARVGADLKLGGAALGIDDLSREPVLRYTGLHVDRERGGDGTSDVVPRHIDDASGLGSKLGEGILIKIEVVGATTWALVGDHGSDALAIGALDGDTGAAVGGIAPVRVGESSSVDTRGQSVLCERALSARGVASVESSLASQGTLSDGVGVGRDRESSTQCSRCKGRDGGESRDGEKHVENECNDRTCCLEFGDNQRV